MNQINVAGNKISPSKVVCIGRNYVDHIKELNNEMPEQQVIFVKPNSAITDHIVSDMEEPIHYEAELSFIIEEEKIVAIGLGLDLTKRGVQASLKAKGLPWERSKAFDKSAVFSDFVAFDGDIETVSMQLMIDGKLIQQGNYQLMIHKPAEIIQEVNTFMSFCDGDILMTGTPKGVGVVNPNSIFLGRIYQGDELIIEQQWQVL